MASTTANSFVFTIQMTNDLSSCLVWQRVPYKELGNDLGVKSTKPVMHLPNGAVFEREVVNPQE